MIFCIRLHPLVMTPIMDCAFKFLLRDCSYSARVNISLLLRILQNDALSSWYMQVVLVSGIMCAAYIQKVICSFRYIYCRSCMQMEWVEVFFPLLYRSFKKISFCPNSKKKNSVAFQCRKKWFFSTIFSLHDITKNPVIWMYDGFHLFSRCVPGTIWHGGSIKWSW